LFIARQEDDTGLFSKDIENMEDMFLHGLQDIYYAEHQIEKALPDMVAKASDPELKKGFSMHLRQTKGQIKRLDQAFKKLKAKAQGTKCPAIDGILDEANDIAGELCANSSRPRVRNAREMSVNTSSAVGSSGASASTKKCATATIRTVFTSIE